MKAFYDVKIERYWPDKTGDGFTAQVSWSRAHSRVGLVWLVLRLLKTKAPAITLTVVREFERGSGDKVRSTGAAEGDSVDIVRDASGVGSGYK